MVVQKNRKTDSALPDKGKQLGHHGVYDVIKNKSIMGNIRVLLRGGGPFGARREERAGARLQFHEFNGSHSLRSAQRCNIAGRRSQKKPSQVY